MWHSAPRGSDLALRAVGLFPLLAARCDSSSTFRSSMPSPWLFVNRRWLSSRRGFQVLWIRRSHRAQSWLCSCWRGGWEVNPEFVRTCLFFYPLLSSVSSACLHSCFVLCTSTSMHPHTAHTTSHIMMTTLLHCSPPPPCVSGRRTVLLLLACRVVYYAVCVFHQQAVPPPVKWSW